MRRSIAKIVTLVSFLFVAPFPVAQAALQRVGPVAPAFGYPTWYQDKSGLTLDFCSPTNAAELSGGWCLILPPVPPATLPVAPEVFPNQFFNEHFYANATAGGRTTGALLTIGLEAAFASGPVIPGDQITFGRIRVVVPSLPVNGDYTVYHPFGVWKFPGLRAGTRLFYTEDVGFNCPQGQFDCALATSIGPFLLPSATPGGAELPPIPLLAAGQDPFYDALVAAAGATPYPGNLATATPKYIADPNRIGPITGSPLPPFVSPANGLTYNANRFRIEVTDTLGNTSVVDDTELFSVQGRIFEGAIPGFVTVDRASYTAAPGAAPKLDVFATATPGMQARVPPAATATLLSSVPTLTFWDNPCVLDPVTLLPIGPPATPAHQIFLDAPRNRYWGQAPPPVVPASVCVAQTNAPAAGGGTTAVYYSKAVEDEVTISQGVYDPTTIGLAAAAASSDLVTLPALSLVEYGPMLGGVYNGTLLPPPATLRVLSSAGGVAEYQVTTTLGSTAVSAVPVAVNDSATVPEDCSATASITPCPTPLVITPLANDTVGGAPIVFGPGVTVTLVNAPRFGTAIVNVDGTISYTPNLNANGVDGLSYTVNVTDAAGVVQRSNVAGVTINITPVNDLPVAVNDTASALVNKAVTITVLANDTDPDFPAETLAVASVTQPVGPVGAIASAAITGVGASTVDFTANLAGTYTFTYTVHDVAGALSNAATVTVTVAGAETLTITPPVQYIVASARWRLSGTDLPAAGQTLTVQYLDGPNRGFPIVSGFPVDAVGNWVIDIRGATGILNPTTAGATQVIVFSSTGGVATAPIQLK